MITFIRLHFIKHFSVIEVTLSCQQHTLQTAEKVVESSPNDTF